MIKSTSHHEPSSFDTLKAPEQAQPGATSLADALLDFRIERNSQGTLCIQSQIPDDLFAIIKSKLFREPLTSESGKDPWSNVELLKEIKNHQLLCANLCRRITSYPQGELSAQETNALLFIAQYLSSARHHQVASSPIEVTLIDSSANKLIGERLKPAIIIAAEEQIRKVEERYTSDPKNLAKVKRANDELLKLMLAYRLHGYGVHPKLISQQLGVTQRTIGNWFSGQLPRAISDLSKITGPHAPLYPPDLNTPSDTRAALLGAYQGSCFFNGKSTKFSLRLRTRETAEKVHALLSELKVACSEIELITGRKCLYYICEVYSPRLRQGLQALTQNNEGVPWAYLGSREEKLKYLESIFCSHGLVDKGRFYLSFYNHPQLTISLGVLLQDMGIPVDIQEHVDNKVLAISTPYGLKRLLDLGVLPLELSERISKHLIGKDVISDPTAPYDRFLALRLASPSLPAAAIARELRVPYTTVIGWIRRGNIPAAVAARENLKEWQMLLGIPHPHVVAYLYRTFQVPVPTAIKIAQKFPLSSVERAVKRISADRQQVNTVPADEFIEIGLAPDRARRMQR